MKLMEKMIYSCAIAMLAFIGMATAATAQVIEGPAKVIDGDSLTVGGAEVRLFGVDAPELSQTCFDNASRVACGAMAKDMLESMIGGGALTCFGKGTDTYGRVVALCRTSGVDIGGAMVAAGWATAFHRYGDDYTAAEMRARAQRTGIWKWDFQRPEEFRASVEAERQPRRAERAPARPPVRQQRVERDGQCLIKGNHSRRGDWIYHLPGMPYYDATRAEAFFCTEAQAQAAGYRRAIVR
jgi:endonuclease YncB( thermonuclease family)